MITENSGASLCSLRKREFQLPSGLEGWMSTESIIATYFIETPLAIEQAAEMIAGEQSSGTFLPVPGETEELKARARARVIDVQLLEKVDQPSLRGCKPSLGRMAHCDINEPESKSRFRWIISAAISHVVGHRVWESL